ncbi:DUF4233 domain-containing protein [Brachybacterium sp. FME24]|uniref:DUF4233 domain-containing protein n=1 Tax=Brachybacterium sp. FME24 TaxID=2742605 RepID=UPI0018662DD2|nr:DUF4233 domain-containing protein [Brachybacterium sp. FME24]
MSMDLTPSPRPHGAQRMFSATTLVVEAFVVFFAVLVAHQLVPGDRVVSWVWGIATALALVLCSGLLKRGAWPYWFGMALQIPVILLGIQVSAMWVVGIALAALFVYGAVKGHQLDREKDAVDARVWAQRSGETAPGTDG